MAAAKETGADLDRDRWRGGERTAVTLVEYGDYECPTVAWPSGPSSGGAATRRPAAVRVPTPSLTRIHPHALAAAHLAEAAALQGRFWPMHESLFHYQKVLEDRDLWVCRSARAGPGRLGGDLDGRSVWQRVQADADSALASGARGTPTLFVNGRRHLAGYDEATLGAALATTASKQR